MKITSISFARGATLNLGNFNSAKLDFGATIELQKGENADAKAVELVEWVNGHIGAEVRRVINGNKG